MYPNLNRSIKLAILSLKNWYSIFGIIVTSVSAANFLFSIVNLPLSLIVNHIIETYRLVVHGAINWILYFTDFNIPGWLKDLAFFYIVVGGASMRSAIAINPNRPSGEIKEAIGILLTRKTKEGHLLLTTHLSGFYQYAPNWIRRFMDFFLWPRRAIQSFRKPVARLNLYTERVQFFAANYESNKPFLYDRRVIIYTQLAAVFLGVLLILIINAFLTLPAPD